MFSLTRNVHQSQTRDLDSPISVHVDRLDFRSALVIEESTALRGSIVQFLKRRGWIAHGIRSGAQALPLLKCIPYHLIVIDGGASSAAAINFARTLHNSEEWNRIPLVIITDSPNVSLASNLMQAGVHSARRGAWLSDLTQILADLEVHGRWRRRTYAS
jgi:DNA-binding NtrC family response regulator